MKIELERLCERFIVNRDIVQKTFKLESTYLYPICAAILTQNNIDADAQSLKDCRDILRERVSIFSNFRSTAHLAMVAMLAAANDPRVKLTDALAMHDALKTHFMTNPYLPVVSMAMTELASRDQYGAIAARTKQIYTMIRSAHPFLTSGEDSVFAALLALSPMSDEEIIAETERCYELLKVDFSIGNGVQSLSHVLALCDGRAEDKCFRTSELYEKLRERGCKYGKAYELGALGVLAMLPERTDVIADTVSEVDAWLKTQSGYGFFGVGARQRLMHAGMLVSTAALAKDHLTSLQAVPAQSAVSMVTAQQAAIQGTLSLLAAQQAAMCAAIAASTAASSAN